MSQETMGGLQIKTSFFPLAFFLFFCTPRITIDQHEGRRPWGTHFFELPPGQHRITICFSYLFLDRCGENSVVVEIVPGQTSYVNYYMWPWIFAKGKMTVNS